VVANASAANGKGWSAINQDGTPVDFQTWSVKGSDPNAFRSSESGSSCVHFGPLAWPGGELEGTTWGDTDCAKKYLALCRRRAGGWW
jgi:hypothetical protein